MDQGAGDPQWDYPFSWINRIGYKNRLDQTWKICKHNRTHISESFLCIFKFKDGQ